VLPHNYKRWRDGGGIMYSKVLFFESDKWWWLSMEDFWAAEAAPNKFYLWLQHPCIHFTYILFIERQHSLGCSPVVLCKRLQFLH
jgi:hypothetical protein